MKHIISVFTFIGLASITSLSQAACSFDVEVGDYLKFSAAEMAVEKSCGSITVNLKHSGKLPANIMDARVLAVSEVIGGGESTSVTFSTTGLSTGSAYTFFCSFPGHSYSMRGTLIVNP